MAYDPGAVDPALIPEQEEYGREYAQLGIYLERLRELDALIRTNQRREAQRRLHVLVELVEVHRGKVRGLMARNQVQED